MKQYSSSTSERHKNYIYEIIKQYPTATEVAKKGKGITQEEIIEKTGLTRQAVSYHLTELIEEERVYYKRVEKDARIKQYFIQDKDIGNINLFSSVMKDAGVHIIDPGLVNISEEELSKYKKRSEPIYRLWTAVNGITVSNAYCQTKFTKDDVNEMYLFEFVNRVGAFLAYIFIESMRPLNNHPLSKTKRNETGSILVDNIIDIREIFDRFCLFFIETGLIKEDHNVPFFELHKSEFDKLMKVLKKLYPKTYEALENYWKSSRESWINFFKQMAETNNCPHIWKETHLYKYGNCYRCYKCHLLVESPVMKEKTRVIS